MSIPKTSYPEYWVWTSMRSRCLNPNNPSYAHYGGRGIKVCKEWVGRHCFENFLQAMGKRPSAYHQIERIDNDGGYNPLNCKWATKQEQTLNRRKKSTNTSGYIGVCWSKQREKWQSQIKYENRMYCMGYFKDKELAALAYDIGAIQIRGSSVTTNIL